MAAIIGKKLGMTQIFREDGTVVPVTVLEAGPCPVTAIRRADRDGYDAVQLAFGEVKEAKLTKAELGHLKKDGAGPLKHLVEFRGVDVAGSGEGEGGEGEDAGGEGSTKVGDMVTVSAFEPGQKVKVSGVSVGK